MKKLIPLFLTVFSLSQVIGSDIQWAFPPSVISASWENAGDPQIAMDGSGNLAALWIEGILLKASTKPADSNWSNAVALSKTQASSPKLVSDTDGESIAIWIEKGCVMAATKSLTGNWTTPSTLSKKGASSPSLAISPSGTVEAVWVINGGVESATKPKGRNWSSNRPISALSAKAPRVAIGGSGTDETTVVVWHDVCGVKTEVYATTKARRGSWNSAQNISREESNGAFADVAVDPNGNATAVWFAYDVAGSIYSGVSVQTATLPQNGNWTLPVQISDEGMRDPSTLQAQVALDRFGNAVALWNNCYDGQTFTIESARKSIGGNWTSAKQIATSNLYAYQANLALAPFGDAVALYMFYNGNYLLIQSTETDTARDSLWSVPLNLSVGANNSSPKGCARLIENTLNTAAVWVSNNSTNNVISTTTGQRALASPPVNLSLTQSNNDFGVFNENYNLVSWDPSPDANIVAYAIFRNGVWLQEVTSDVLQFVDHNQAYNGSVTYGVAAIDDQNSMSPIVTISR